MREATRILSAVEEGAPQAAELLLPLVYKELLSVEETVGVLGIPVSTLARGPGWSADWVQMRR